MAVKRFKPVSGSAPFFRVFVAALLLSACSSPQTGGGYTGKVLYAASPEQKAVENPAHEEMLKQAEHAFDIRRFDLAEKQFAKACGLGSAEGCLGLGKVYEHTFGKLRKSLESYIKACDMGSAQGCVNAGYLYEYKERDYEGAAIKKDDERALSFYERACRLDGKVMCGSLGVMYEHGEDLLNEDGIKVKRDYAKAKEFYELACVAGDSCFFLGKLYQLGLGVSRDLQKAKALYRKDCELTNFGASCYCAIETENCNRKSAHRYFQ